MSAALNETKLRRVLKTMLDENEFLSPYGIRSISRYHAEHPYVFQVGDQEHRVSYLPAESDSGMFGGNSNWRGPIWMPVNGLIIRALLQYSPLLRRRIQDRMSHRLRTAADPLPGGRRDRPAAGEHLPARQEGAAPVYGGTRKFQEDPHWRDLLLFYEYFHGDNGAGLGASHQTGWTGIIARIMHLFATTTAEQALAARQGGRRGGDQEARCASARPGARRERRAAENAEPDLSVPLSDQHPGAVDRVVTHPGPARPRWTTSPTPNWTGWPRWGSTGSGC